MAEKNFNVRILNKIDTLENWNASSLIIKQGEICIATVAANAGTGLSEPVVMIKIGEGDKTFSELPFNFYAKAADVIAEAKSTESLTTFINNVIANAGIATDEVVNALSGRVTTAEGKITALEGKVGDTDVATQISEAIAALDLANTYEAKGAAAAVQGNLDTYKTLNDAAVAAAKKAGDDAQSTINEYKTSNDARVQAVEDAINGAEPFEPISDSEIDALFA